MSSFDYYYLGTPQNYNNYGFMNHTNINNNYSNNNNNIGSNHAMNNYFNLNNNNYSNPNNIQINNQPNYNDTYNNQMNYNQFNTNNNLNNFFNSYENNINYNINSLNNNTYQNNNQYNIGNMNNNNIFNLNNQTFQNSNNNNNFNQYNNINNNNNQNQNNYENYANQNYNNLNINTNIPNNANFGMNQNIENNYNKNEINNNKNQNNYNIFNTNQKKPIELKRSQSHNINYSFRNINDKVYNNAQLLQYQQIYGDNNPIPNTNIMPNVPNNNYFNPPNKINGINNANLAPKTEMAPKNLITLDYLTRARGLENVGATCYMNATLQCLYHVKNLSENLINDDKINKNMKLTFYFRELFIDLAGCRNKNKYFKIRQNYLDDSDLRDSVRPIAFKNVISEMNPLFKGVQANDSKDLILFLLETMDKELTLRNNNKREMKVFTGDNLQDMEQPNFKQYHNSIFSDIFYGFQKSVMKCNGCKNENPTYSIINFIVFPLEKFYNELNKQKNVPTNNNMNNNYYANNYNAINANYYNYNNNNMYGYMNNMNNYMYSNNYNNFQFGMGRNNINSLNPKTSMPSSRKSLILNKNAGEKKKLSLKDCFKQYKNVENLTGANQIYCNNCKKSQDGVMYDEIYKAPNVLIIILNRGRGNSFDCDVEFPIDLNLNDYISNPNSPKSYELIGVISHLGESSMEGHFIAYCKHFDNNWYIFNDSIVKQEAQNGVYNGVPYILFYKNKNWN